MAHYVDNKSLYATMVEFKVACKDAEECGEDAPPIPDMVGAALLKIANRLSTKPNFINYTFREEMVSDGIENCINYIGNFDPNKSKNPFAYFTQIIYYAFLRRIQKEKKQLYIKHKAIENHMAFDEWIDPIDGTRITADAHNHEPTEYMKDFVKSFESKEKESKQKKKPLPARGVEQFYKEK
jgi:DNA-directed RNA polymerase specialized sigma24 family protein